MKKLFLLIILLCFVKNVFSQVVEGFINVSLRNDENIILNISYDYKDDYSNIKYINIETNRKVYALSISDITGSTETIMLNKDEKYLSYMDNKYSKFNTELEKILLDNSNKKISLYDNNMKEITFIIKDILNVVNTIKNCFKVFNDNNIIMGDTLTKIKNDNTREFSIILEKSKTDKYPVLYLSNNEKLEKYFEKNGFENKIDFYFFDQIENEVKKVFYLKKHYKNNYILIEYSTEEIRKILGMENGKLEISPKNINIYDIDGYSR